MAGPSILIVDDDTRLTELVAEALKAAGYTPHRKANADSAFEFLQGQRPALMLLDIRLPGINGMKLLELIKGDSKTAAVPVIMMTSESDVDMKVKGLKGGADDYIVKPFKTAELVARVDALLRRMHNEGKVTNILEGGGIKMDLDRLEVTVKGKHVPLSSTEFELLALLIRRKGQAFTYQMISDQIGKGSKDLTSGNLYQHMKKLRQKLGSAGDSIETLYGTGYKFLAD